MIVTPFHQTLCDEAPKSDAIRLEIMGLFRDNFKIPDDSNIHSPSPSLEGSESGDQSRGDP
jgi:hypothetical protein